jgi:hypothetical protein
VRLFLIFFILILSTQIAAASGLSLEELHSEVDNFRSDGTVEEFLIKNIIPAKFDLVLIHDSRSLQFGDKKTPRLLLVSPNKHLTLSIGGYPYGAGWETIEVLQLDLSKSPPVAFAEIVFSKNALAYDDRPNSVKWNGYGPPERRCEGCHQAQGSAPFVPIFPTGAGDGGFWGYSWDEKTLNQWNTFKTTFAKDSRYALFASEIQRSSPESLNRVVRDYFNYLALGLNRN